MSKFTSAALVTAVALITALPFAQAEGPESPGSTATEQTAVAEKTTVQVNPNKRVCKKIKPMGSHITQKVCLRQRDWEAVQRKEAETLGDWTRAQSSGPNSGQSASQ